MRDIIKAAIAEVLDTNYVEAYKVADIIKDYFGEALVDVQRANVDEIVDNLFFGMELHTLITIMGELEDPAHTLVIGSTRYPDLQLQIPAAKWRRDRDKEIFDIPTDDVYCDIIKQFALDYALSRLERFPVTVLIRFPKVTVTNENDASIDITELYVRCRIKCDGILRDHFSMMRTEYTATQYLSHYSHSHLPGVSFDWQYPCLGSGPIESTERYLLQQNSEEMWGLFCYELSKYVTVESLSGVPYRRLESVGNSSLSPIPFPSPVVSGHRFSELIVHNFLKYYVRTCTFKVAFSGGVYVLGCDPITFILELSKCFISWYNRRASVGSYCDSLNDLLANNILGKYVVSDNKLYFPSRGRSFEDITRLQGRDMFVFKGNMVKLNFTELHNIGENNVVILLNHNLVSVIMTRLLRTINYEYGHQKTNNNQTDSTISEKIRFL